MKELDKHLQESAVVMKIAGWGTIAFLVLGAFIYPPGVLWGSHPMDFPHIGPAHPPSPYAGFHPYLFMIVAMYLGWAILLIRGAKDPRAAASLFDWGILANGLHVLVMLVQAFIVPNEHAHLWTDVPAQLVLSVALWIWHRNRVISEAVEK